VPGANRQCGFATLAICNDAMRQPLPPEMGYLAFLHPLGFQTQFFSILTLHIDHLIGKMQG
jgi:hypothetical protein